MLRNFLSRTQKTSSSSSSSSSLSSKPRVVIALGGNALQKKGEVSAAAQKKIAAEVGQTITQLSRNYEIIISHGNGPQVGNILLHEENAATASAPAMPLETAVAMSQGQIGYWLAQAIDNAFAQNLSQDSAAQASTLAVSLVTQVLVDPRDSAFTEPSKPIGEFYDQAAATELIETRGWTMHEDSGRGYRRVVPSPKPIDIIESSQILALVQSGAIVIAAGGGGIPVIRTENHQLQGVDAVIDKDFAAAKLALLVDADFFVSVTAVPNAYIHFGQPNQTAIGRISRTELEPYLAAGYFGAGSMLPKIEAVAAFVDQANHAQRKNSQGTRATQPQVSKSRYGIITSPENLAAALALQSGTIVTA